jgi:ABC transport system ATP-binding/permease protein
LEKEIEQLEAEKTDIEAALSSGSLTGSEIEKLSVRFSEINGDIDEKTLRWMELSELAG